MNKRKRYKNRLRSYLYIYFHVTSLSRAKQCEVIGLYFKFILEVFVLRLYLEEVEYIQISKKSWLVRQVLEVVEFCFRCFHNELQTANLQARSHKQDSVSIYYMLTEHYNAQNKDFQQGTNLPLPNRKKIVNKIETGKFLCTNLHKLFEPHKSWFVYDQINFTVVQCSNSKLMSKICFNQIY